MLADDNPVRARWPPESARTRRSRSTPPSATTSGCSSPKAWPPRPELTTEGVREGLELVKLVPSAEGRAGTTLGFGHWDHGALHGQYLVLRQWVDAASVEVT